MGLNGRIVLGLWASVNGRVVRATLRAVDEETVHLVVLGVQQDRPAVPANEIDRVGAGV